MCRPKRRRVFRPFWSENGYGLSPFWSGIGYGFRGNYGSVWMWVRKKEKDANLKWFYSKEPKSVTSFLINYNSLLPVLVITAMCLFFLRNASGFLIDCTRSSKNWYRAWQSSKKYFRLFRWHAVTRELVTIEIESTWWRMLCSYAFFIDSPFSILIFLYISRIEAVLNQ